jgi:dihydroorotate dehydrogenase
MYRLIRPILFRLDPESVHEVTKTLLKLGQPMPGKTWAWEALWTPREDRPVELWGMHFRNPVGIAAGFDKNAELVPFLRSVGFGFVEIGTVTLLPQPGNPKPRLFRYPRQKALVNRLGFNNEGTDAVAKRLERWGRKYEGREARGEGRAALDVPLFVNIGKNKDVPLDEAPAAYRETYRRLAPLADAVVVNVSSPNTPNLRDLQRPESLVEILTMLRAERTSTTFRRTGQHPILVKLAPDLDDTGLREIVDACRLNAEGIIATNTTIDHSALVGERDETGGLSGRPLFGPSTEGLRKIREQVGPDYPLVGVGGVFTAADLKAKLAAGADLVQAYTGFIYEGPGFVKKVLGSLPSPRQQSRAKQRLSS